MIRVILCDDHAVVRRGIRDTLADAVDIEVVGEAGFRQLVEEPRLRASQVGGALVDLVERIRTHHGRWPARIHHHLHQNHRHRLLRRGQRGLQPVRRVAAIMNAVAMLPFVDGLLSRPEPLRQD